MKGFLAFLLIISLIANAVLLFKQKDVIDNSTQQISITKLNSIAKKCGVSSENAEKMDAEQLLTEINIRFNDSIEYDGNILTADDLKTIEALLFRERKINETIKKQDAFIQKIQGKSVIILP